jgi:hypothetical protein
VLIREDAVALLFCEEEVSVLSSVEILPRANRMGKFVIWGENPSWCYAKKKSPRGCMKKHALC